MRNVFDASIDRGGNYAEDFGKPKKSRRLRSNEYIDGSGYIRRGSRLSNKSSGLFDTIIVIGIAFGIISLIKYWDKILYAGIGISLLFLTIFFIYRRWKK